MAVLGPGSDRPAALGPGAPAEDGESLLFCLPARNAALGGRGKKQARAVAGRRSRPLPSLGPDQPIRGCVGREPMSELTGLPWLPAPSQHRRTAGLIERKSAPAHQSRARCARQSAANWLHVRARETTAPLELSARLRSRYARSGHDQDREPDGLVSAKGRRDAVSWGAADDVVRIDHGPPLREGRRESSPLHFL